MRFIIGMAVGLPIMGFTLSETKNPTIIGIVIFGVCGLVTWWQERPRRR